MPSETEQFYDSLADAYHLIFEDWDRAIAGQAGVLDALIRTRPTFQGPSFFGFPDERRIVHQVWDWTSADAYDVHQYISLERDHRWEVLHFSCRYRCLLRAELTQALLSAGFVDVEWLMPSVTGYYQPIVFGRVP